MLNKNIWLLLCGLCYSVLSLLEIINHLYYFLRLLTWPKKPNWPFCKILFYSFYLPDPWGNMNMNSWKNFLAINHVVLLLTRPEINSKTIKPWSSSLKSKIKVPFSCYIPFSFLLNQKKDWLTIWGRPTNNLT